jgi:cytosine/adenosine deaminase-related metal-dependent hydrolase
MDYVSGEILTVSGFKKGYLGFEKNKIVETGKESPPKKPICKGLIVPSLVNAHTHIGDSFIREKNIDLPKNLEELVAPPNGLKHRLLKEVSDEEILEGMEKSINIMIKNGTKYFCDFRENGIKGIDLINKSLRNKNISGLIFSRPQSLRYDINEVEVLIKESYGVGVSSISDWDYFELKKLALYVNQKNRFFSIHASECFREDIDLILDLKPDFLVHMVFASESDLIRVKDEGIPIIVCPRSNSFFGLKPDVELMKKVGVNLLIGTDNAMLNSPNILDEMVFFKNVFKGFSYEELLIIATFASRKALNLDYDILGSNSPADFMVLDGKNLKPLYVSKY